MNRLIKRVAERAAAKPARMYQIQQKSSYCLELIRAVKTSSPVSAPRPWRVLLHRQLLDTFLKDDPGNGVPNFRMINASIAQKCTAVVQ